MKACPKCGYRDHPNWRHSRFDFNADYMRFDEATQIEELNAVTDDLMYKANFKPFDVGEYRYYRRGTGGLYLYRVLKEDFRVPRERKRHKGKVKQT